MAIKNIIFDLGGVLLNLAPEKTEAAFDALAGDRQIHLQRYQQLINESLFNQLEVGAIHEDDFLKRLQETNPYPVRLQQLRRAWNVMLLDFPTNRLQMIQDLKRQGFGVYLLSNINSIHLSDVYTIIQEDLGLSPKAFDQQFDKVYYSHLIQRRKPDISTFQYVIHDADVEADETLFIDDTIENIISAKSVGLHAIHHERNGDIVSVVEEYLQVNKSKIY